MKTKVKVMFFKESGKWYDTIKFTSEFKCHETDLILEEIAKKYSYPDMDFVFSARTKTEFNSRLLIKSK